MNEALTAIWVAIIVAIVGPLLQNYFTGRQRKKEREEDRADRARVAASVQVVAETAKSTKKDIGGQLKEIHKLVNSDKTEGLMLLKHALASNLWWMRREVARFETAEEPVPKKVSDEIAETEKALSDLNRILQDRSEVQAEIDAEKES